MLEYLKVKYVENIIQIRGGSIFMINIVITAGGTVENIDEVRKITNTSTGKLATFIYNEIIEYFKKIKSNDFKIHYIVSATACRPSVESKDTANIIFYEVTDTESVENTIIKILEQYKVNYFIHSMAISDFTVSNVVEIKQLAKEINDKIKSKDEKDIQGIIEEILKQPENIISKDKKISSSSDICLLLKNTPKIISLVKERDKDVFLVGFKLLKNVTEAQLIEVANNLAEKNKCDLVLANDMKYFREGKHIGLLIKDKQVIGSYEGKKDIAEGIVVNMFKASSKK